VAPASCKTDIAKQYQFGRSIGVNGTPNIILPNGTVVPGYQPADQLLSTLQSTAG
ncbi:thioredoxin fold domain-containing protein, partial [Alteromonas sp. LMIT007]